MCLYYIPCDEIVFNLANMGEERHYLHEEGSVWRKRKLCAFSDGNGDTNEALTGAVVGRLVEKVGIVELRVMTTLVHQDFMTAFFDHTAVAQDEETIGVFDG